MNKIHKIILQSLLLCNIFTVSIFSSDPQDAYQAEIYQELAKIYEETAAQVDQINAGLQQVLELITLKKLKVSDPIYTRQNITKIIYYLEDQKAITSQLTFDNIGYLAILGHISLQYFLAQLPDHADNLTLDTLIKSINTYTGEETLDRVIELNKINLEKFSYICDTAGLSYINKTYRYFEKKNIFTNAQTTAIIATATLAGIALLTYNQFAIAQEHIALQSQNPGIELPCSEVLQADFNRMHTTAQGTSTQSSHSTLMNLGRTLYNYTLQPLHNYVIQPVHSKATQLNLQLFPTQPVAILPIIGTALLPSAKEIYNFAGTKWENFTNYLRGETANKKQFVQTQHKKVYFKDLIGAQHLEKIADEYIDYLKHPERYDRSGTAPSKAILLVGPPQTGKSLFAAALQTALDEEFKDSNKKVAFINVDRTLLTYFTIEQIFDDARYYAPCIIFFDEIDMIGASRERNPQQTGQLLTCMSGINSENSEKKVFVIAATNKPEQLDYALLQHGRFGKVIPFEYPKFEERKTLLNKLIYDRGILLPDDYVEQLAKEIEGLSYNAITSIITEAMRAAKQAMRLVKVQDIDDSFDKVVRKIAPYIQVHANMQSKQAIAAYQAGKAAAHILCNTQKKLAKVTIKPIIKEIEVQEAYVEIKNKSEDQPSIKKEEPFTKESYQYGGIFTYCELDSIELTSNKDQETEVMCLLAGQIVQEMLLEQTFNRVYEDDAKHAKSIIHRICADPLLIKDEMLKKAHLLEQRLEDKVRILLLEHKDLVQKLYEALLKHETLDREMLKNFTV